LALLRHKPNHRLSAQASHDSAGRIIHALPQQLDDKGRGLRSLRDLFRGSRIQASRPASRNGVGEDRLEIQCLNDAGRGKARQITAVKVASAMAAMSG